MTSPADEPGRYEYEFDPERENDTAAAIFKLAVEGGPRVLDIGCGRGIVSGALVSNGHTVVGVDADPHLLADAAGRGLITIKADLTGSWAEHVIEHGPYDVMILADILEHLNEPGDVLDTIRDEQLLAPGGWLIVSIPNASHEAMVVNLLTDRFAYSEEGLLDRTHLRWFTASSFVEFAEEHGYSRTRHIRVRRTLEQTMHGYLRNELVDGLREQLLRNDDHRTYQHIMRFEPMEASVENATLRRTIEDERRDAFVAVEEIKRSGETERAEAAEALEWQRLEAAEALEWQRLEAAEALERQRLEAAEALERQRLEAAEALEQARSELVESEADLTEARSTLSERESDLDRLKSQLADRNEDAAALSDLRRRYDEQFVAREALFRKNRELEGKLEGVYQSETFRLGAAILKNPRRLKRAVGSRRRRSPSGRTARSKGELRQPKERSSRHSTRRRASRFSPELESSGVAAAYKLAIGSGFRDDARYRVAITVSTVDLSEGRGDPYTAIGLGRQLERLGVGVCYLPPEQWHDPPAGTDIVLSMLAEPTFGCLDPLRLPKGVRRVAWIRNNTDRWVANGALQMYDAVLCSSERTRRVIDRLVQVPNAVLPIGVDAELFDEALTGTERTQSLVATMNQWGAERRAYAALAEAEIEMPVGIYGVHHGLDPRLTDLENGKVDFFEMPSLYRRAMFVLDDQQAVNRPFNNTNSRIFESILMGAIPITDTPSGPEVSGLEDVPVWTDATELAAVINDLAADDEARRALSLKLQDAVRSQHTYVHRAAQFDAFIADSLRLDGPVEHTNKAIVGFWPDYRGTNPFQDFLIAKLGDVGATAIGLQDPSDLMHPAGHRGEERILHLHWTAPLLNPCQSQSAARRKLQDFFAELDAFRSGGGRLIWTIHNLMPHESHYPELEVRLRQGIADRSDIVHVMCPETVELAAERYRLRRDSVKVIGHGSFAGVYPNAVDEVTARQRFGFGVDDIVLLVFGQIRPYKGIDDLLDIIESAREIEPRLRLLVAGKVGKFPGARELIDRLEGADGVVFVHEEVDDDDVQDLYAASDVSVIPYRSGLNSGALLLSFSFGRPAIAPAIGCLAHGVPSEIATFFPAGSDGLREAIGDVSALLGAEVRIQAQGHADSYTLLDMAQAYAEMVGDLIEDGSS